MPDGVLSTEDALKALGGAPAAPAAAPVLSTEQALAALKPAAAAPPPFVAPQRSFFPDQPLPYATPDVVKGPLYPDRLRDRPGLEGYASTAASAVGSLVNRTGEAAIHGVTQPLEQLGGEVEQFFDSSRPATSDFDAMTLAGKIPVRLAQSALGLVSAPFAPLGAAESMNDEAFGQRFTDKTGTHPVPGSGGLPINAPMRTLSAVGRSIPDIPEGIRHNYPGLWNAMAGAGAMPPGGVGARPAAPQQTGRLPEPGLTSPFASDVTDLGFQTALGSAAHTGFEATKPGGALSPFKAAPELGPPRIGQYGSPEPGRAPVEAQVPPPGTAPVEMAPMKPAEAVLTTKEALRLLAPARRRAAPLETAPAAPEAPGSFAAPDAPTPAPAPPSAAPFVERRAVPRKEPFQETVTRKDAKGRDVTSTVRGLTPEEEARAAATHESIFGPMKPFESAALKKAEPAEAPSSGPTAPLANAPDRVATTAPGDVGQTIRRVASEQAADDMARPHELESRATRILRENPTAQDSWIVGRMMKELGDETSPLAARDDVRPMLDRAVSEARTRAAADEPAPVGSAAPAINRKSEISPETPPSSLPTRAREDVHPADLSDVAESEQRDAARAFDEDAAENGFRLLRDAKRKVKLPWADLVDEPHAKDILQSPEAKDVAALIPPGSKVLGAGHTAIVFETPEGKALRISRANGERPQIPEMIQAEKTERAGPWQIETSPKADTAGITEADVAAMEKTLNERGYTFSDPGTDNLGRLPDGRLVVIDPGAVSKLRDLAGRADEPAPPAGPDLFSARKEVVPSERRSTNGEGRSLPRHETQPAPGLDIQERAATPPRGALFDRVKAMGKDANTAELWQKSTQAEKNEFLDSIRLTNLQRNVKLSARAKFEAVLAKGDAALADGPPPRGENPIVKALEEGPAKKAPAPRRKGGKESGAVDVKGALQGVADVVTKAERAVDEPFSRAVEGGIDKFTAIVDKIPRAKAIREAALARLAPRRNAIEKPIRPGGSNRFQIAEQMRRGAIDFTIGQGERMIARVEKASRGATDAELDGVYRWMNSEAPSLPDTLRPEMRRAVEELVGYIDGLRKKERALGTMSPQVYDEYPRFLTRHMRAKVESGRGFLKSRTAKIDPNVLRQDAYSAELRLSVDEMRDLAKGYDEVQLEPVALGPQRSLIKFKPTPEGEAARAGFLEHVRETFKGARSDLGAYATGEFRKVGKGGDIAQGKRLTEAAYDVPRMKDVVIETLDPLPDEVRAELEELRDPHGAAALTIRRSAKRIADAEFFQAIEHLGSTVDEPWISRGDLETGDAPEGYVKLGGKTWGSLDGAYARPDVHEALSETFSPAAREAWSAFLRETSSAWKTSHFVLNPGTHGRNIASVPIMAIQAGVNPVTNAHHFIEAMKILSAPVRKGATVRERALYEASVREGVVKQDLARAEAAARALEAYGGQGDPGAIRAAKHVARVLGGDVSYFAEGKKGVLGKARDVAKDVYGLPDDLVRMAKNEQLRGEGLTTAERLSELDATTSNYSMSGKLQRGVTRTPLVGPAANFAFEMYRLSLNNARRHPLRLVAVLGMIPALQAILSPSDDEQAAAEQQYGPLAIGAGRDDAGHPRFFDPRYVHPVGQQLAGPQQNLGEKTDWGRYLQDLGLGGENPWGEAIAQRKRGTDKFGRRVFEDDDLALMQAFAVWRNTQAPPAMGRNADRMIAALKDETYSPYRPKQTPAEVAAGFVTGITLGTLDPSMSEAQLGVAMRAVMSRARDEMVRKAAKDDSKGVERVARRVDETATDYERRVKVLEAARKAAPAR